MTIKYLLFVCYKISNKGICGMLVFVAEMTGKVEKLSKLSLRCGDEEDPERAPAIR